MKKYLFALILMLFCSPAFAACDGVFPVGTVCGNPSSVPAPPKAMPSTLFNAAANGWVCDSVDRSTQAQALINLVGTNGVSGGGTIEFPPCIPAFFTGTASGTNLTVTGIIGNTLKPGMIVAGAGIPVGVGVQFTTIVSQSSGTPGGNGVYVTSQVTTASAASLVGIPTYRADSKLTFPLISNTGGTGTETQQPIRFSGTGSGTNINGFDLGFAVDPNAAVLDLRFKGQVSSAVGYVQSVGSGYTPGTQTVTITGGTCSQQPVYQVVVTGGGELDPSIFTNSDFLNTQIGLVTAGNCTVPPPNPVSFTGAGAGTGGTLRLEWTGGKIQALGAGALEIDRMTIVDASSVSNSTPMIYTTNTTLSVHNNQIYCSGNAQQDAIVLGGMQGRGKVIPGSVETLA